MLPNGRLRTRLSDTIALVDTSARRRWLTIGIGLILFLPRFADNTQLNLLNIVAISVIGAVALNMLTGLAGQISLGQAAFLAVGAFTSGALVNEWAWPFLATLPAVAVVSALLGLIVGLPAVRLRGLYLALATFAFHFIVIYVVSEYESRRTGASGVLMPQPGLGIVQVQSVESWYYFLTAVAVAVVVLAVNVRRSRVARQWVALRERDIVASALGINVMWMKLKAFVFTAVLTGISGALLASYLRVASAGTFTFDLAIEYVAMIIIGGLGTVLGAVLGAMFVVLLPEVIAEVFDAVSGGNGFSQSVLPLQDMAFGLAMLVFILFEPGGLVGIWRRSRAYVDLWPLRYRPMATK